MFIESGKVGLMAVMTGAAKAADVSKKRKTKRGRIVFFMG